MKKPKLFRKIPLSLLFGLLFLAVFQSTPVARASCYDFNGDGGAELSFFKTGRWRFRQLVGSNYGERSYGQTSDIPVPANYEGASCGIGVFRPGTNTVWYIYNGAITSWGSSGDKPAPADYDGDGKADLAVWRPSNGTWYIIKSSDSTTMYVSWGSNGDIPVAGQFFNTDNKSDFTVFRPSNSTWYALSSYDSENKILQFGTTGDRIVPADYDDDGLIDFAVYRGSGSNQATWWISESSTGDAVAVQWGIGSDIPVPAVYTGTRANFAVYRESNHYWYILTVLNSQLEIPFGEDGDVPIPNFLYR